MVSCGLDSLNLVEPRVNGESSVAVVNHHALILAELLKICSGSISKLVELSLDLQSLQLVNTWELWGADNSSAACARALVVLVVLSKALALIALLLRSALSKSAESVLRAVAKSATSSSGSLVHVVIALSQTSLGLDSQRIGIDSSILLHSALSNGL